MLITKNFSLNELLYSETAKKQGINNYPSNPDVYLRLVCLAYLLQAIRDDFARPITVTSGYRCDKLNTAVGGVKNSRHVLGLAADIKSPYLPALKRSIDKMHARFHDKMYNKYLFKVISYPTFYHIEIYLEALEHNTIKNLLMDISCGTYIFENGLNDSNLFS